MTRDEVADYIGERYGALLAEVGRSADDSAGNLQSVIDDAFRALGYLESELATAAPTEPEEVTDVRIQALYRAIVQIRRDLATRFDVSIAGDSYRLSQVKAAVDTEVVLAEAAVLERFGTLGVVITGDDASPFVTIEEQMLWPPLVEFIG
jgi:hypothetical protein